MLAFRGRLVLLKKGISQKFSGVEKLLLVGDIATFENQILLPINGRNLKDGSLVISLQYLQNKEAQDSLFLVM
jgi:hypothetical protein